ncbi:MAG TPA: DUF5063 domain-containing protein [Gemmatimonadales bacterium]|nr:DUF5063 domain-containing protein [Gemmatimonadales bacterium]
MSEFKPISSPALDAFVPVAERYCALIETYSERTPGEFLAEVHGLLPRIYAAALALPLTDVVFDKNQHDADAPVPESITDPDRGDQAEWSGLVRPLGAWLGKWCHYRDVFDPYESLSEPEVTGSLADDLCEIYRELRSGLRKWKRGDSGGALWEWRFGFETHWGKHSTGALRAVHSLASAYETGWPAPESGAA